MNTEFFISRHDKFPDVVLRPTSGPAGHMGVIIPAGSRDELAAEQGLAHFIEHNLFKGTSKRNFYRILNRIDGVGGELNAYTAKEETCLYASFEKSYLERAFELISDIIFHSVFPESELVKEKKVVLDEINSYLDSPGEMIFDEFDELCFPNHSIGRNILGNPDSVQSFKPKNLFNFINRTYHIPSMVISVSGAYDLKHVELLREKYFNEQKFSSRAPERKKPKKPRSFAVEKEKDTYQAHVLMGGWAYKVQHPQRAGLVLLNNILGGNGMNSRLNLNIREKYGFTYSLDSGINSFSDCGSFFIYAGTDKQHIHRVMELVKLELKKLRTKKLGPIQLHQAQKQLCGNLVLAQENNSSVMLALGRSLSIYKKIDTLGMLFNRINAIKSEDILNIANEVYMEENINTLIYY